MYSFRFTIEIFIHLWEVNTSVHALVISQSHIFTLSDLITPKCNKIYWHVSHKSWEVNTFLIFLTGFRVELQRESRSKCSSAPKWFKPVTSQFHSLLLVSHDEREEQFEFISYCLFLQWRQNSPIRIGFVFFWHRGSCWCSQIHLIIITRFYLVKWN